MPKLSEERRFRRSEDRYVALRYQLEHTRGVAGIEALVLADDTGLVVASSGDAAMCAELGAIAPLASRSFMGMPLPPLLRASDLVIKRVEVLGQELYLACTGGGVARDAHLRSSMEGVQRILTAN